VLPGAPAVEGGRFRLLQNGIPVTAQFRPVGGTDKEPGRVYLDFNVNHGPLEKQTYLVEFDPAGQPGPERKGGMRVETVGDAITVLHSPSLDFVVPRDLLGLLRHVHGGKTDYLRPGSPGLLIRSRDQAEFRVGGTSTAGRVTRTGPLATALRFEGTATPAGGRGVASVVEMEFPSSKSWVQVTWTVADAEGQVAGLAAELNLNTEAAPTLVDFGAGSYVYVPLRKGQRAVMRAGPPGPGAAEGVPAWTTLVGLPGALKPYVVAPPGGRAIPAEGWAHVMDQKRCTAVAVQGFAAAGQESELRVDADGRLRLERTFARAGGLMPRGPKRLAFWLHFVPMPVQVGAATSPQAMLAPLRVEVRPER
jgi:hypothetical protein